MLSANICSASGYLSPHYNLRTVTILPAIFGVISESPSFSVQSILEFDNSPVIFDSACLCLNGELLAAREASLF